MIVAAVKDVFELEVAVVLTRPDEQFGDFATNVALQISKQLGKSPREVAEQLAVKLRETLAEKVADVSVAGPGFLNITLEDSELIKALGKGPSQTLKGKSIVIEHTDPNPFKAFHIGHAYSNTIGVSIGFLLQAAGARVHQVSYHGDVGMHVAMAIWAFKKAYDENKDIIAEGEQLTGGRLPTWLGKFYAEGARAYKEDEQAKSEIEAINKLIYNREDEVVNLLYDWGKERSFFYFDMMYDELSYDDGTQKVEVVFEKRYYESDTGKVGKEKVLQNVGTIFEESDGAIIYSGEKVGLHTRVFINKQGLPTYEAKEIGLTFEKEHDYPEAQEFIIITANEIDEYFKVLVAAVSEIDPKLGAKMRHVSHGIVRLPSGKMSSRTGKVIQFLDVFEDLKHEIHKLYPEIDSKAVAIAALKYSFLKHRVGSDLIFDLDESISLEGNSGPYLQYAHARAKSILTKAGSSHESRVTSHEFEADERSLLRKITEYTEVVDKAVAELMPHHICTYLYELAQKFNQFYEHNRVIGDEREAIRLQLVRHYAHILQKGLNLLGITAPTKM